MEAGHANALRKGQTLKEYEIETVLGEGGFGITYLARQTALNKRFAIKEYLPRDISTRTDNLDVRPISKKDAADFDYGLDRFMQEARILAKFSHPNIVQVQNFFEAHRTAYLVMDYEDGKSLAAILNDQGVPSEARLRAILFPLLDGLSEVHDAGILHRDIKPDNIFVRRNNGPVLLDFGAARHALGERSRNLTSIVTPGFAPHEQYYASGQQSPATDIYALGATLYYAVAGEPPVEAPARVNDDPLVPAVVAGKGRYGQPMLAAIDAALRFRIEDRPQDVASWRVLFGGDATASAARDQREQPSGDGAEDKGAIKETRILNRPKNFPVAGTGRRRFRTAAGAAVLMVVVAVLALALFPRETGFGPAPTTTADTFKESLRPRILAACMKSRDATEAICACRLKTLYGALGGKELEVVVGMMETGPEPARQMMARLKAENPTLWEKIRQAGTQLRAACKPE